MDVSPQSHMARIGSAHVPNTEKIQAFVDAGRAISSDFSKLAKILEDNLGVESSPKDTTKNVRIEKNEEEFLKSAKALADNMEGLVKAFKEYTNANRGVKPESTKLYPAAIEVMASLKDLFKSVPAPDQKGREEIKEPRQFLEKEGKKGYEEILQKYEEVCFDSREEISKFVTILMQERDPPPALLRRAELQIDKKYSNEADAKNAKEKLHSLVDEVRVFKAGLPAVQKTKFDGVETAGKAEAKVGSAYIRASEASEMREPQGTGIAEHCKFTTGSAMPTTIPKSRIAAMKEKRKAIQKEEVGKMNTKEGSSKAEVIVKKDAEESPGGKRFELKQLENLIKDMRSEIEKPENANTPQKKQLEDALKRIVDNKGMFTAVGKGEKTDAWKKIKLDALVANFGQIKESLHHTTLVKRYENLLKSQKKDDDYLAHVDEEIRKNDEFMTGLKTPKQEQGSFSLKTVATTMALATVAVGVGVLTYAYVSAPENPSSAYYVGNQGGNIPILSDIEKIAFNGWLTYNNQYTLPVS